MAEAQRPSIVSVDAPGRQHTVKRTFDVVLAAIGLPVVLPVCVAAAIAIRIETEGSPVFIQERVGQNKEPIRVMKLRTMHHATGDLPSHEVSEARVTRVGKFLRRVKVDELPQLWNVLRGDMSFVGPRPCLPSQHEVIEERDARGVLALRPGITGPSQLAGIDMSTPIELAESDARYIGSFSPAVDFGYVLQTAVGRGSGDAVVRTPSDVST